MHEPIEFVAFFVRVIGGFSRHERTQIYTILYVITCGAELRLMDEAATRIRGQFSRVRGAWALLVDIGRIQLRARPAMDHTGVGRQPIRSGRIEFLSERSHGFLIIFFLYQSLSIFPSRFASLRFLSRKITLLYCICLIVASRIQNRAVSHYFYCEMETK